MALALLFSLLIHALLLSLPIGGGGLGLARLVFPWEDRRVEAPDLHVVLVPSHATPVKPAVELGRKPSQRPSIERPVADEPGQAPPVSPARRRSAKELADVLGLTPRKQAETEREPVASAFPTKAPIPTKELNQAAPPQNLEPAAKDVEPSNGATSVVRAVPPSPTSVLTVTPSASSPEPSVSASRDAGAMAQELQRLEASRRERARVEEARLEAERQESARQEAARIESARLEAEHQEAARQAAAKLDAQRDEAARQEAARIEAARLESERQEASRQVAARLEAQRQEAARQEAARVATPRSEAERQEAAPPPKASRESPRDEAEAAEARREAVLRAIGRQLDEEADRRQAASPSALPPSTLPLSLSTARRVRVWGRTHPNDELIQYVEAWARKIQLNTAVETVREVAKRSHTPPMVTVAIRSSGSVDSVTFVVSSGVAYIDDAIRRIVESQKPYPAFPPALSREFDVIEIRRTWYFDAAVRLY